MLQHNRVRHALQIINNYGPNLPLHHYLRNYYRLNKSFGSKDRRLYRHLAYSYFRSGKNFTEWGQQVKLVLSAFLVSESADDFLEFWLKEITPISPADTALPLQKKFTKLKGAGYGFSEENIFPWKHLLGNISDPETFAVSHLIQPYTWIKIFNSKEAILAEAESAGFKPLIEKDDAIAFAPAIDLTRLNTYNKGFFEIQDHSSQRTAELMQAKAGEDWWDCCAGAGGKSLLLKKQANVNLFATDVRPAILSNLKERAWRHNYNIETAEADLMQGPLQTNRSFNGIIADAPCTGSGTWGRSPERVNFFSEAELDKYTALQKEITANAAKNLRKGGRLIYLTCSVFKAENELVVEWLNNNTPLRLLDYQYFEGYSNNADTLFGAAFIKE